MLLQTCESQIISFFTLYCHFDFFPVFYFFESFALSTQTKHDLHLIILMNTRLVICCLENTRIRHLPEIEINTPPEIRRSLHCMNVRCKLLDGVNEQIFVDPCYSKNI